MSLYTPVPEEQKRYTVHTEASSPTQIAHFGNEHNSGRQEDATQSKFNNESEDGNRLDDSSNKKSVGIDIAVAPDGLNAEKQPDNDE